jgi:hypothetical protein
MMRLGAFAAVCAAVSVPWSAFAVDGGAVGEDAGAPSETGPPDHEAPPKPLIPTSDLGALTISSLHVVIERKGDRVEVSELMTFTSREGTRFSSPRGLRVALPKGALAPRTADADGAQLGAEIDAEGLVVTDPISPGGDDLSLSFEVPISGGEARFEQRLPVPASSFQVVSTWTRAPARLRVAGAGEAVRDELENGLVALIAMGRGPESRTLAVTLSGIEDGAEVWLRRAALAACLAIFIAGVIAFARRRRGERREAP